MNKNLKKAIKEIIGTIIFIAGVSSIFFSFEIIIDVITSFLFLILGIILALIGGISILTAEGFL